MFKCFEYDKNSDCGYVNLPNKKDRVVKETKSFGNNKILVDYNEKNDIIGVKILNITENDQN